MTTAQFILNCATGSQIKPRTVSSVYFDGKHVYSYGLHYPLLININNKWIVNRQGYSSTTSKHIAWASYNADFQIKIPNNSYPKLTAESLRVIALNNLQETQNQIDACKNKATIKCRALQAELIKYQATYNYLTTQTV